MVVLLHLELLNLLFSSHNEHALSLNLFDCHGLVRFVKTADLQLFSNVEWGCSRKWQLLLRNLSALLVRLQDTFIGCLFGSLSSCSSSFYLTTTLLASLLLGLVISDQLLFVVKQVSQG